MTTQFHTSGKIVVVDDEKAYAAPMLELFAKEGLQSIYFEGNKNLPNNPPVGVRLLVLDLILTQAQHQDSKNVCASIARILPKIISAENGPYFLLIWSFHDDPHLKAVLELFENDLRDIAPIAYASLEKTDVFETTDPNGTKTPVPGAMDLIRSRIDSALSNKGLFRYLLCWENTVHKSAAEMLAGLSHRTVVPGEWEKTFAGMILELAEANAVGKLDRKMTTDVFENASSVLNDLLADSISSSTDTTVPSAINVRFESNLTREHKAKLNAKMLIDPIGKKLVTGLVFCNRVKGFAPKDFIEGVINNANGATRRNLIASTKMVCLEVSPACDWANDKIRKHRILVGALLDAKYAGAIKSSGEYFWKSPIFYWNNAEYLLIFDFRYLFSASLGRLKVTEKLFTLKHSFIGDIQHRLGHHISRPGTTSIKI